MKQLLKQMETDFEGVIKKGGVINFAYDNGMAHILLTLHITEYRVNNDALSLFGEEVSLDIENVDEYEITYDEIETEYILSRNNEKYYITIF